MAHDAPPARAERWREFHLSDAMAGSPVLSPAVAPEVGDRSVGDVFDDPPDQIPGPGPVRGWSGNGVAFGSIAFLRGKARRRPGL
jgi:hypothetical protein